MNHSIKFTCLLLVFLSVLVSGCATVEVKSGVTDEISLVANIDDSDLYEKKSYGVFGDQGDHLEELVKGGYFRKAARLYEDYYDSYFDNKLAFSSETKRDKYRLYIDAIAKSLSISIVKEIDSILNKLNKHTIWPLPINEWEFIESELYAADEIIKKYDSLKLYSEDKYKLYQVGQLILLIDDTNSKLETNSPASLANYNIFKSADFFETYPYKIKDEENFVLNNFDILSRKFKSANCEDIETFHSIYKEYIGTGPDNLVGNFYIDRFIHEQSINTKTGKLAKLLEAIKSSRDKGFVVRNIKGTQVSFVDATSKTLLKEGYIEFPAETDIDLPFQHKVCDLKDAFSETIGSNYLIVFDVAQASVKRRIKTREQVRSKYVSGYKDVSNPSYKQAIVDLRKAERGISSAQNAYCGTGLAGAFCGVAKAINVAAWQKNLNAANQAYISTPEYLQEEIHKNYNFSTSNVEVTKSMTINFYVLDRLNKKYFKSAFDASEEESFQLGYSIKDEDTKFYSLKSKYKTEDDIEKFEKKSISVKLSSLMENYTENILSTKVLTSEEELRSEMLKDRMISLTNYKNKKIDTRSLNDPRLDYVVVVYNPKGSLGSGFFVKPNVILTNYHVVEGSKFLEMKLHNGLETFGKVIKSDVRLDLALIRVEASGEPVTFIDKTNIDLGEQVEAIGHPKGLDFSITRGIVSAIRKLKSVYDVGGKEINFIQTDAAINPGNSGGPLFLGNKVIGVNNQKIVANSVEGLGFAIHASEVLAFMKEDY